MISNLLWMRSTVYGKIKLPSLHLQISWVLVHKSWQKMKYVAHPLRSMQPLQVLLTLVASWMTLLVLLLLSTVRAVMNEPTHRERGEGNRLTTTSPIHSLGLKEDPLSHFQNPCLQVCLDLMHKYLSNYSSRCRVVLGLYCVLASAKPCTG